MILSWVATFCFKLFLFVLKFGLIGKESLKSWRRYLDTETGT